MGIYLDNLFQWTENKIEITVNLLHEKQTFGKNVL